MVKRIRYYPINASFILKSRKKTTMTLIKVVLVILLCGTTIQAGQMQLQRKKPATLTPSVSVSESR